jgi:WD40-like Beta Propeller Repeat
MSGRRLGVAGLILLMIGFGVGVWYTLGTLRHASSAGRGAKKPDQTHPEFNLPGTIIVAQGGTLYKLANGTFTPIAKGSWTQPAVAPDHQHIVAVRRDFNYSDLYLLGMDGSVQKQLTNNANGDVPSNQWAFYPRVAPDNQTLFYNYDPKYEPNTFSVNLSVFAMKLDGTQHQALRWTYPNMGPAGVPIGGDLQPVPLPGGGGIIEARYDINQASLQFGQIWLQEQRRTNQYRPEPGHALTPDTESCYAPALSPDGTKLAMICADIGQGNARLVVAPFDGQQLGPPAVVAQGQLNSPTWAPDGTSLLYLAPGGPDNYFQIWHVSLAPPATPKPAGTGTPGNPASPATPPSPPQPRELTTENNFDATSPPVWF